MLVDEGRFLSDEEGNDFVSIPSERNGAFFGRLVSYCPAEHYDSCTHAIVTSVLAVIIAFSLIIECIAYAAEGSWDRAFTNCLSLTGGLGSFLGCISLLFNEIVYREQPKLPMRHNVV